MPQRPYRSTLLLIILSAAAAAMVGSPKPVPSSPPAAGAAAVTSQLNMVEHEMPLMAPHQYEAVLREAMADRGELLRWYIGRVDKATGTAIAECVILPQNSS